MRLLLLLFTASLFTTGCSGVFEGEPLQVNPFDPVPPEGVFRFDRVVLSGNRSTVTMDWAVDKTLLPPFNQRGFSLIFRTEDTGEFERTLPFETGGVRIGTNVLPSGTTLCFEVLLLDEGSGSSALLEDKGCVTY